MGKHWHYIIQAYRAETEHGGLADAATVDVIVMPDDRPQIKRVSDNRRVSPLDAEQFAIEQAQTKVHKASYRVSQVVEHDADVCPPGHRG